MPKTDISKMAFAKIYPLLVQKAEKKGRTRAEVDLVTSWLTGYSPEQLSSMLSSDINYGDFFGHAPCINPDSRMIKGSICGVKVETIEDPFMRNVRCLDKLVDDLAKGKSLEKMGVINH